ncbi:hypothetical protein D9M71_719380 [compost metagenome]
MGAQTDQHQDLRLDRTVFRVDVGRLNRCLGFRVGEVTGDLLEVAKDLFGAADDEDRLATPFSNHLLTWLYLGDIDLHRCTCGFRLGTGKP